MHKEVKAHHSCSRLEAGVPSCLDGPARLSDLVLPAVPEARLRDFRKHTLNRTRDVQRR